MESVNQRVLAINGGSSSIKFALFENGNFLEKILYGQVEKIGYPDTVLRLNKEEANCVF